MLQRDGMVRPINAIVIMALSDDGSYTKKRNLGLSLRSVGNAHCASPASCFDLQCIRAVVRNCYERDKIDSHGDGYSDDGEGGREDGMRRK